MVSDIDALTFLQAVVDLRRNQV